MVQVEMSNMYIDMGVNNGSEKWTGKNTAAPTSVFMWEEWVIIYAMQHSPM